MSEDFYCPNDNGILEFVGSVGITLHEGDDVQADRWDCPDGHTILVIPQIEDPDEA
jgi:hypothetical protein